MRRKHYSGSCLRSDIVILDTLIVLLTYLLTYLLTCLLHLRDQGLEERDEHSPTLSCGTWLTLPFLLFVAYIPSRLFTTFHRIGLDAVPAPDRNWRVCPSTPSDNTTYSRSLYDVVRMFHETLDQTVEVQIHIYCVVGASTTTGVSTRK